MEDFRLHYASRILDPEKAGQLTDEVKRQIAGGPVPSVRPNIPEEMEYVGTGYCGDDYCFDYYQLPDGQLRQEYRRKHQDIIISFNREGKRRGKKKSNIGPVYVGAVDMAYYKRSGCERTQSNGQAVRLVESRAAGTENVSEVGCLEKERGRFEMVTTGGQYEK